MRATEILSIGEAVLAEEPKTPEQAVKLMQLKVLNLGWAELEQKATRFQNAAKSIDRDAKRIQKSLHEEFEDEF